MPFARFLPALAATVAAVALAGCDRRPDVGAVVVSVIGEAPALRDPARRPPSPADRVMLDSLAQGLVRFDAAGQIEPGLAERWIVIDDGMSYIFRLRDAEWPDGTKVTARDVATILNRQIAPGSRNPLAPYLTAIDRVVEMTPEVIEVELKRPRPDLLKLFAQPELAVLRTRPAGGTGPFHIITPTPTPLLTPVIDPNRAEDEIHAPAVEENVRLIAERTARALVRFARRESDLVTGGTIVDWPLVAIAGIAPANVRIDPTVGLFGLVVVRREGMLADATTRDAIAGAFDRAALTGGVAAEWQPADQILPEQLDSAAPPARAGWTTLPIEQRRASAVARVAASGASREIRVALPPGPGATRLWAGIAATLIGIGLSPVRVVLDDPAADLRLIDAVAPYDNARWYLATACAPCGAEPTALIEAARVADTPAARAAATAAADAALTTDAAFIPLARPLRWSVVSTRLRAWQPNARAWHPLNRLRPEG